MVSTVYDAAYAALVREELLDPSATALWTDAQIVFQVDRAVREFARYYPRRQETCLAIRSGRPDVNIAALSGLRCIHSVEFPADSDERSYRTTLPHIGNYLELDISFTRTVTAESPTAGTIGVTNGSTAVTGSSTVFTTDLTTDDFINNTTDTNGEYYKVHSLTDATNLVLDRPYQGTTGSGKSWQFLDKAYIMRIIWGGQHTLTDALSTLDTQHEETITAGACAFTLRAWAAEARQLLKDAWTEDDKMSKPINDALEHIVIGAPKINDTNVGNQVAALRAQYAVANLQRASARGETASQYLSTAGKVLEHVIAEADRRESQFRADCLYWRSQYPWPRFQQYPRGA